jgi:4-carboxymuconolactone decarboxylase
MDKALYETGAKIRREVLGDAAVERSAKAMNAFNRPFMEFMIEYCWGGVWGQPVLDRKQRSLNNLCILSALNRPEEFKLHVKGALTNGCTLEEIAETLMQVTVYCGVPAGVNAFRLAREVFDAEGIKIPD